jgi:uncharacterized protein YacL (UPF0231 family)
MEFIMDLVGTWVSILEYAALKHISISTIRRQIKNNDLQVSSVGGKYYIWVDSKEINAKFELEQLRIENQKLLEEINDLKMLLSVYEGKHFTEEVLPPLPELDV